MAASTVPPASTSPTRLAILGLDSADLSLYERLVASGRLPVLRDLFARALRVPIRTQAHLFTAAAWPSILTGTTVGSHGRYAFRQLDAASLSLTPLARPLAPAIWDLAAEAGRRSVVLDAPHFAPQPSKLEALAREAAWGVHPPRGLGLGSPQRFADALVRRFGRHPRPDDDPWITGAAGLERARRDLVEGAATRGGVIEALAREEAWDLLVACFSEAHVAGHQFANVEDPEHPCHDPAVASSLGGAPSEDVARAVDAALGRALAALPPGTPTWVILAPGIRTTYGGEHLLEAVLERLGLLVSTRSAAPSGPAVAPGAATGAPASAAPPESSPLALTVRASRPGLPRRALRGAISLWRRALPERLRAWVARRVPEPVRARIASERFRGAIDWTRTRAFAVPCTFAGLLRVNLRGRERLGVVPAGERAALLHEVEGALRDLVIEGSGEPAAGEIVRPQERCPGPVAGSLPDLVVSWRNDRPFRAVTSARTGRIEITDPGRRPDHADRGLLLVLGGDRCGGEAPGELAAVDAADLGATALARLGVALPPHLQGQPIDALLA